MQKRYNNRICLVYICNFYKHIILHNIRNTHYDLTHNYILDKILFNNYDY